MSGFTLKEIDHDKVVMVKGEETLIVKVIDSNVKKDREIGSTNTSVTTPAAQVQPAPGGQPIQRPLTTPPKFDQAVKPSKTPYRPR